jgi:hypothetical protein
VGTRAFLDVVVKRKPPTEIEHQNPNRPARSLVTIPTELSRIFKHGGIRVTSQTQEMFLTIKFRISCRPHTLSNIRKD